MQDNDTFTITGDIIIQATSGEGFWEREFDIIVDKLKVVYNHNGMLDCINKSEHKNLDVFQDAERYFVKQELDSDTDTYDYRLATDGSAVELYADFEIYDEDVY